MRNLLYFFGNLIFFKGTSQILLGDSMTISGAIIMALVVTAIMIALGIFTNLTGATWIANVAMKRTAALAPLEPVIAYLGALLGSVLLSYFVLIGFSPRLASRIDLIDDLDRIFDGGRVTVFVLMAALPVTLLWGAQYYDVIRIGANARRSSL